MKKILSRLMHLSAAFVLAFMLSISGLYPATVHKALADAADPVLPIPQGSVVHNGDGTITVTMDGQWQWTTHFDNKGNGSKDCNQDRYATGYAIDWNDATQPGNLVQNGSIIAHVGTPTDNNVHYIHLPTDANPTGDPVGATRCGVYAQHGVDSKGHPIFYNTGNWGPISHTYPIGTTTFSACVVTYDVHNTNTSELTAGGPGHNGDNSVEKNGSTPLGNGCFSPTVPSTLNLAKSVTNDNGGTKTPHDWTLTASGTDGFSDFGDSTTFHQVDAGVTYTLSESNVAGYDATGDFLCSGGVQSGNTITLSAGQNVTCTINNDDIAPSLTLNKIVSNTHGGTAHESDWTISATGPTSISGPGAAGSADVVSGSNFAAGTYTLSESAGPSGYSASTWSCTNNVTVNGQAQITLDNGQTTVCTITNSDVAPSLTVVKNVTNNNGGTKTADMFPLKVNSTTLTGGTLSNNNLTDTYSYSNPVAGTAYTVSETQQTGYSQTSLACADNDTHAVVTNPVTLNPGQHVTCTIANDDIAPSLTVNKLVINPYGTKADANSFPLFVDGNHQVTNGQPNTFNAGNHTVSENQQAVPGYTLTDGSCDTNYTFQNAMISLTLNPGDNVTCTLTNTAIQPKLIVIKHVINDNSGTQLAKDFWMTVSGNTQSVPNFTGAESPGTTIGLNEGPYAVDETSHVGYAETKSTDCSGTISVGETKTCTITNNDIPNPGIHIVKSGPAVAHEGDLVTYTYAVTNTGDTDLSNVTVDDNIAGQAVYQSGDTNNDHILPKTKTETWIFTKTYTVPTPQVPDVVNIGTACGDYSDGTTSGNKCSQDTHTLDIIHPAINVKKSGPDTAFAGDTVTYTFKVANPGDTPLSINKVNDNVAGDGVYVSGDTHNIGFLDTDETWTYTKQFTIPSNQTSDIINTVTACGSDSLQLQVCNTDDHTTTVLNPGIHVVKSGPSSASAGTTVTYTFTVTNTGNVPLSGITVNDNIAGAGVRQSGDTNNNDMLDLNETWIYTKQYTIPAGQTASVNNTVTACGMSDRELESEFDNIGGGISEKVCDTDTHTLTIPKVLGETVLVNTGESNTILITAIAALNVAIVLGALEYSRRRTN